MSRLRSRAPRSTSAPAVPSAPRAAVELQLAIGRSGVGFELGKSAELGPLVVTELAIGLPLARFPVDVSGGVARFRHTRGILERLTVELPQASLTKWLAPRLRGVLGDTTPTVWVAPRSGGLVISVSDEPTGRTLAFDVFAHGTNAEVHFVPGNARGLSLPAPASQLATHALMAALGRAAKPASGSLSVVDLARRVCRALLPEAGARVPDSDGVRVTNLVVASDVCILHMSRNANVADASAESVRAREACALTERADAALLAGDHETARARLLEALERAPRHPEVARRIADIDRIAGGRAEAAIALLSECDPGAALLLAELAMEAADAPTAIAALRRAAQTEPSSRLAALAWMRAAELSTSHHEALDMLDRAVGRAPTLVAARMARLARRLRAGRLKDASADAEELEALARGAAGKHRVWREVAREWHAAGFEAESATFFERALRYDPEDPDARAGLGSALIARGSAARGVALLAQAVASDQPDPRWTLALARGLAEAIGDRPAAIARARSIDADVPEAIVARGLEATWRADLGDVAGATVAFAELRDLAGARVEADPAASSEEVRDLLIAAAHFHEHTRRDLEAAQTHLAVALRLRPADEVVLAAYRANCARLAAAEPSIAESQPHREASAVVVRDEPDPAPRDDDARAEQLILELRAHPDDDAVADELADVLTRLGRGFELLALLSARLEDASPARRLELVPRVRATLERLEAQATADGNESEAALYRDARGSLA